MNKKKKLKNPKNKNGVGSLYYDFQRDRYRLSFTYKDANNKSCRKAVYGITEQECYEKRESFLKKNILFRDTKFENATITNILTYLYTKDYQNNTVRYSTYERNLYTVSKIEEKPLGKMHIYDIQEKDIIMFLNQITTEANSTIKKIFTSLNKAFDIALYYEIINKNPMNSPVVQRPLSNKEDKKVRALTIDEEIRFINELQKYKPRKNCNCYVNQLYIAMFTGMRIGEINTLQVSDIDLENGTISVNKTVTKDNSRKSTKIANNPKTKAGIRTILIPDILINIIEESIENMIPNDGNFIFYDINGKYINDSQVSSFYRLIANRAGIKNTNLHGLRHTFGTRCIESGVEIPVLKDIMGHSDIKITINTYVDILEKFKESNIQKINEANAEMLKNLDLK